MILDKKELLDYINNRIVNISDLMISVEIVLLDDNAKLLNERFKGRIDELEWLKKLVKKK
ncbi:MAG: hypothetical protein WC307_05005 [Candidatus Nanoarchaeia archaeon]|jgi:hypothetical protein